MDISVHFAHRDYIENVATPDQRDRVDYLCGLYPALLSDSARAPISEPEYLFVAIITRSGDTARYKIAPDGRAYHITYWPADNDMLVNDPDGYRAAGLIR